MLNGNNTDMKKAQKFLLIASLVAFSCSSDHKASLEGKWYLGFTKMHPMAALGFVLGTKGSVTVSFNSDGTWTNDSKNSVVAGRYTTRNDTVTIQNENDGQASVGMIHWISLDSLHIDFPQDSCQITLARIR